jgi:hypothetical protein
MQRASGRHASRCVGDPWLLLPVLESVSSCSGICLGYEQPSQRRGWERPRSNSGGTNQLPDHLEEFLQIEGLEEVAVPPDGVLLLGSLEVLL